MPDLGIALHGATGRMGETIRQMCVPGSGYAINIATPQSASEMAHFDAAELCGVGVDVVIDFSHAQAVQGIVQACEKAGKPLVSGTTGISPRVSKLLQQAGQKIPVLWSPNMSPGVNLCRHLVGQMARSLGAGWDVEIVESHHAGKVDSPSGTALHLGQAIAAGWGKTLDDLAEYQRHGSGSKRAPGAIGFSSIRGGDIAGEHSVLFIGQGERLELVHKMTDRTGFARGALGVAKWLVKQGPGLYHIDDFLGLQAR